MCDLSSACFTNSTGNTSGLCPADWRDLQWVKSPQLHWDMFRSAGSAAGGVYGENCSCLLQTGGLGSAQQMPQGWVAPCKLILHFMCKAELSRLGECPLLLLSLLAGGCPAVTASHTHPSPATGLSQQQLVGSCAEPSGTQLNPS